MKLHLGCGKEKREGWVNVDIEPSYSPDVIADVKKLDMFEDNSVEMIETLHLLEHLTFADAKLALKEWYRVLKTEGQLFIELPDLQRCIEILEENENEEAVSLAMMGIYGGSYLPGVREMESIHMLHKTGWKCDTLTKILEETGFRKINKVPITQTWRKASKYNRDMRLECIK